MKKNILRLLIAFSIPMGLVFAATPTLSISPSGDGNNVSVTVTGAEGNTSIALYFKSTQDGTIRSQVIGTTNTSGGFSGTVTTSNIGINITTPIYVMVNGYSSNTVVWPYYSNASTQSQITFNQNNPYVVVGQNGTLIISGGTGNYYIASNQNSGTIGATISGNTLYYSGIGNGSSIISVCSANGNICGTTTISTNSSSNGALQLSQSTLTLAPLQTGTIQVGGGSLPYTATTITGDNLVYTASGNSLSFTGSVNGTRTINICSTNNLCSILTVNVTGTPNNNLILNPSSINLTANQVGTVQISGGNGNYTSSITNGDTLYTSISGNVLSINSTTNGTRSLNICSTGTTCSTLTVNVGGASQSGTFGFSLPIAVNQVVRITLTGGNGSSYYLQSGATYPITASISGNIVTISGSAYGTSVVTVCQSGNSICLPMTFVVNQAGSGNPGTGGPYTFNNDLWYGETNNEVIELQKFLIGENYLSSEATGFFGSLTLAAVKKYQLAKGISATGYVGPLIRGSLNN